MKNIIVLIIITVTLVQCTQQKKPLAGVDVLSTFEKQPARWHLRWQTDIGVGLQPTVTNSIKHKSIIYR